MIKYNFSFSPKNNILKVSITLENLNLTQYDLRISKWRPGRYQFQNYAKNILNFQAFDKKDEILQWKKTKTNVWTVQTKQNNYLRVEYDYYANELNAGSCLVNNDIQYINPINACLYLTEHLNTPLQLVIHKAPKDVFAYGLPYKSPSENLLVIDLENTHQLFDQPFILSKYLKKLKFKASNVPFTFWIYGTVTFDTQKLISDLTKIAEYQIKLFGEFPEDEYHFMLIIPKINYYHGVEHANSTVLVIGQNQQLNEENYLDLLGLASHELFHAWNIAKIRPLELSPYNYDTENYFTTCFVAEGYTTYYGDKILFDCGILTKGQYQYELENIYRRHFEDSDEADQSLLESSFDLWVDGYEKGTPNKKVSVYHKGAIAAQVLDLMIKRKFNQQKSLDDVLKKLWIVFGKTQKGYSYQDIVDICSTIYEGDLSIYFDRFITGNQEILTVTNEYLQDLNIEIKRNDSDNIILIDKN